MTDPDAKHMPHGSYEIVKATLLAFPELDDRGDLTIGPPPTTSLSARDGHGDGSGNDSGDSAPGDAAAGATGSRGAAKRGTKRVRSNTPDEVEVLATRLRPDGNRAKAVKAKVNLGAMTSVGVMDVGTASCNIVIGPQAKPVAYFDVGYPLYRYVPSAPENMRFGEPAPAGPIRNMQNLQVFLSHWDWDHWRLGPVWELERLHWTVPNQPIGPVAIGFWETIPPDHRHVVPPGQPQFAPFDGVTVCRTTDTRLPRSAQMNNTGLAMKVATTFEGPPQVEGSIVMTGDANFSSLPDGFSDGALGIIAVHHGASTHHAADNLPAAPQGGRVAYSYGMQLKNGAWVHNYGHPRTVAVAAYRQQGWTVERSTAEGEHINGGAPRPPERGNIRFANNDPLPHPDTAFGPAATHRLR